MSGGDSSGDWWTWGSSLVNQVKQQTAELVENALPKDLVEATKRDLQIFVTTVTDESAKGIAHTAEKFNHDFHLKDIEGGLPAEVASLVQALTQRLMQTSLDTAGGPHGVSGANQKHYTRREQFLHQLHNTPTVFITDPANINDFDAWAADFNLETHESDVQAVLEATPSLKAMFSNLVPKVVTRDIFWARYYYHIHKFDLQQQERDRLKQEASARLLNQGAGDDGLEWDDDEPDHPAQPSPSTSQEDVREESKEQAPGVVTSETGDGDSSDDSWLMAGGSDDSKDAGQSAAAPDTAVIDTNKDASTEDDDWDEWE